MPTRKMVIAAASLSTTNATAMTTRSRRYRIQVVNSFIYRARFLLSIAPDLNSSNTSSAKSSPKLSCRRNLHIHTQHQLLTAETSLHFAKAHTNTLYYHSFISSTKMKAQAAIVSVFIGLVAARPQGIQFPDANDNGGCVRGKAFPGPGGKGTYCIAENGDVLNLDGTLAGTGQGAQQSDRQTEPAAPPSPRKIRFAQPAPPGSCKENNELCLGTLKFCRTQARPQICLDSREPAPSS